MTIDPETFREIRRRFFVDHWTVNAISQSLGVHHETVRRAINQEGFHKRPNCPPQWSVEHYREVIEEQLKKYPALTSTRLTRILKDRGYSGSTSMVRRFVRTVRPTYREAFVKRVLFPGEEMQVDWAHFGTLTVGRAVRKLYCIVMTLSFSRAIYIDFTFEIDTESFLRQHVAAFKSFGGVPRVLLYDNLKSAVLERCGSVIRFNPRLLELAAHYHFEPRACRPFRGSDKGRTERKIRYVRQDFFYGREPSTLADLNADAARWVERQAMQRPWPQNHDFTVAQKFAEEKSALLPLPSWHPVFEKRLPVTAKRYPLIRFDRNDYSISPQHVGRLLTLRADSSQIAIDSGTNQIALHPRCWDAGQTITDLAHEAELKKSKAAGEISFHKDRLTQEVPGLITILMQLRDSGESMRRVLRSFAELRAFYGTELFREGVTKAIEAGTPRPQSVSAILLALAKERQIDPGPPLTLPDRPAVRELHIDSHQLDIYDKL